MIIGTFTSRWPPEPMKSHNPMSFAPNICAGDSIKRKANMSWIVIIPDDEVGDIIQEFLSYYDAVLFADALQHYGARLLYDL